MRFALALLLLAGCGSSATPCDEPTLVFAAASLRDVMQDVVETWPGEVRFNFAGSNVLAMQIEATDAADLFISADLEWMDRLDDGGKLVDGSRVPLLSNRLVLIAHRDAKLVAASPSVLLSPAVRHVSIADPQAVPAGRYARRWLESEGLWQSLQSKVAPSSDVRAAMRLVEADSAVLGVVYATDARSSSRVQVLLEATTGPEIRYPAALVQRPTVCPSSRALLDHMKASGDVFDQHGFSTL